MGGHPAPEWHSGRSTVREGLSVFERVERDGIAVHTVPEVFERFGVGIAFSERGGGVSAPPYDSLDLAGHVGDDPLAVDINRRRLLDVIGIGTLAPRLTTSDQVHGSRVVQVAEADAGAGACVASGPGPITGCDGLWTQVPGIPLLLMFADCVPVIVVDPAGPAVAVVHAGWRGLAAGVVERAVQSMEHGRESGELMAFVGPHIGPCCYEIGDEIVSHFGNSFVTITAASKRFDLGAAVTYGLERAGIPKGRQWHLGICTAHTTDRFYSHRAEGRTGRHSALAVIL